MDYVSDIELHFTAPLHEPGFADVTVLNSDGLMDSYAGALYYLPVEQEREEEEAGTGDGSGDTGSAGLDGDEAKEPDMSVSCSHARAGGSSLWLVAGLLGFAARRRR